MSARITISLNDDDPRHADILEWINGFASKDKCYRSRAVSMHIIAVLHEHTKQVKKKAKKNERSSYSTGATPSVEKEYRETRKQPLTSPPPAADVKTEIEIEKQSKVDSSPLNSEYEIATPTRRKASSGLSVIINSAKFD